MTSRRAGCSLLSLLPLLASLPNFLLLQCLLLLPCSSSSLTLDPIPPTTPVPTTLNDLVLPSTSDEPNTTTQIQDDDWVEVLSGQDDDYDDDNWLLNLSSCSSSDFSHDQSPRKDTVDFHDVRNQIVEHVLGKRGALSDPEHLRLRAKAAWKRQGGQRLVLKGPLLLRPDGELQESSEESEEAVQASEEASINKNDRNRTITEVEKKVKEDDSGGDDGESGDGTNEGSGSGDSNSGGYSDGGDVSNSTMGREDDRKSGNHTERSDGVDNDSVSSEMVAGARETISKDKGRSEEGRTKDEEEEQGEETDLRERKEDELIEEKKMEEITEVTVEEGTRLRLVCNVTGVKHIWVEWRRAANLTFPGGSTVVGGRSVLFDFVGREDSGTYICTARNPHGSTYSTSVTIHVQ